MRKRLGILLHAHVEELECVTQLGLFCQKRADLLRRRVRTNHSLRALLRHSPSPIFGSFPDILSRKGTEPLRRFAHPQTAARCKTAAASAAPPPLGRTSATQCSHHSLSKRQIGSQFGDCSRLRKAAYSQVIGSSQLRIPPDRPYGSIFALSRRDASTMGQSCSTAPGSSARFFRRNSENRLILGRRCQRPLYAVMLP